MKYQVEYTQQAVEDLKGLSRPVRSLLYGWIEKNLADCEDPRRHGTGDPEGGRWRYQIGEYRILAEIQEDRILILTVLAGLRRTSKQKKPSPNIFLRSTLRQPVKTSLLLAVLALITFAFVSRVSGYLLVKQETERLEGYYRSIGTLEAATGDKWTDPSEIAAYLEENPYVQTVQTIEYTSAVIQEDIYNVDLDSGNRRSFIIAFCGTLNNWDSRNFYFTVDTPLNGYPEYVSEGGSFILHRNDDFAPSDVEAAYEQLEKGGRYLAVGYYREPTPGCEIRTVENDGIVEQVMSAIACRASENSFFVPVSEDIEAALNKHRYKERIQLDLDEHKALNIIPVKDMSALPSVQDAASGIYLTDGRWLDSTDDAQGSTVCVINEELASKRGLKVGDTLTLKLRDIPSHFGYFTSYLSGPDEDAFLARMKTETDSYEIVGIYAYTSPYGSTLVSNFTYIPASVVPETFTMTTPEYLDEIAWGTVLLDDYMKYAGSNYQSLPHPRDISFVLASPDMESQFLTETRSELAAMGWTVTMIENNWDNFQTAAVPMRRSSLLNAAIFTGLLLVTMCLDAFIYYRMRRKEIFIARALGVPRCAVQVSIPLLLLGILGIGAGGVLGWRYTLQHAANVLASLSELGNEVSDVLPWTWLAAMLTGTLVLLVLVTAGGASLLVNRPALTLLQNGAAVVKENDASVSKQPKTAAAVWQTAALPKAAAASRAEIHTQRGGNNRYVLRFVWRHIVRSRLKSALMVLLAAGFAVGLAVIHLSIAGNQDKIDWLYEHTPVKAELLLADTSQTIRGGGFIRQDSIDALLESGYITDAYLEGNTSGAVIRYEPGMKSGQAVHGSDENMISKSIRAFGDEEIFLSAAGSGGAVTITYFDGWDGSLFAQEWPKDQFPAVLPKAVYEQLGAGDKVGLYCQSFYVCEVAGYYEGDVVTADGNTDPALIPLSAYQQMSTSRLVYSKAHVTLNPSLNRELEAFTQTITEISTAQRGAAALRAVIWDEELRLAVAPLENSIKLMRVLYPVTLALSLLAAVGLAVLFVMTSAKEAAIIRVLGTSRLRSSVMLVLQTAFTSTAGLLTGLVSILLYIWRTQPELLAGLLGASVLCAALYLLAAVLGSAVSASILTGRNPLELLQVKE